MPRRARRRRYLLDGVAPPWCLRAHEHRRPQNPSLVAHLL